MKKITNITLATVLLITLYAFMPIISTSVKITVRNGLGNTEEGVKVILYETHEDYKQSKNPITEPEYTDKKGNVTFKNLEPTIYFVDASKGDLNNFNAGVKIDSLKEKRLNKVTIIID